MATRMVLIDPGHGGKHPGCAYEDLVEKDVNLQIAKRLVNRYIEGARWSMTRLDDDTTSFRERRAAELECKADLVVSIHVNASPRGPTAHGMECYHWPGSPVGMIMARHVSESAPLCLRSGRVISAEDPHPDKRGDWIERPRTVLGAFGAPIVLVECGYATNPVDREFLLSANGQAMVATSIEMGIIAGLSALEQQHG